LAGVDPARFRIKKPGNSNPGEFRTRKKQFWFSKQTAINPKRFKSIQSNKIFSDCKNLDLTPLKVYTSAIL